MTRGVGSFIGAWEWLSVALAAALGVAAAAAAAPSTELTPAEKAEVQQRIQRFYADPTDGAAMLQGVPKYDASDGKLIDPNDYLKPDAANANALLNLAGKKATPEFDAAYCHFLTTHFPGYRCPAFGGVTTWSTAESDDRIESLAYSWMSSVTRNLDQIPTNGATKLALWSDDYWKTRYGQTSYRYATKSYFNTYMEAIRSYSEPREWDGLVAYLDPGEIVARIIDWSPSEKYDLSVGDEKFSLTQQQKDSGRRSIGSDGNVESWMGLCHGWSAASIMVPRPTSSATLSGVRGLKVTWYPADVRAMLTLAWGNGTALSNFVGGRCRSTHPDTFPNGRIRAQECFDTNPATFHLALGNMIGRENLAFVMDATYDYQVWNQPVSGYEFTYFDPTNPGRVSKNWRDVAVPYDAAFKAHDRFQSPLTRGIRTGGGSWDDSGIAKVVGVTATVAYLIEQQPPEHVARAGEENYTRATYTYDLELHDEGGTLVAEGGEWHETAHPDFLWIPRKTTSVRTSFDYLDLGYNGTAAPTPEMTETATQASAYGYPLCQVLKQLVKQSSGTDAYRCPLALP